MPHSIQRSPSEQFEHFSPQVSQTTAQFEQPYPQEQTISTQSLQSEQLSQKYSAPAHSLQVPQSRQSSPSEHSLQCSLHSGHTVAHSEQPLPQMQTYSEHILHVSQLSQKFPSPPTQSLQTLQPPQISSSAQFVHFSLHSGHTVAHSEQPLPQEHTCSTQFLHSPHSAQ